MQNDENKNNDAVLASTNTNEQQKEQVELTPNKTIAPTELQDNLSAKASRDLSAIIPQEKIEGAAADSALQSKDKTLKSDGAVVIGNIENDVVNMVNGATFPTTIDIEKRKKQKLEELRAKKSKKTKKDLSEDAKKAQNITAIIALIAILFLGGFFYYYKTRRTDADFSPKSITLELGESLPIKAADYVEPGIIGATIDDLTYTVNTSDVIVDEVGEYEYTVTHNGSTKTGTITIEDTTPPELEVKEVRIVEGASYTPESFVVSCKDLSGCDFSFEKEKSANYTDPGEYTEDKDGLVLVAKDPYGNTTKKGIKLTIESKEEVKRFKLETPYNEIDGYSKITTYELHFSQYSSKQILYFGYLTEEYTYSTEEKYNAAVESTKGEENYQYTNNELKITHTKNISDINTLNEYTSIKTYLESLGYTETE